MPEDRRERSVWFTSATGVMVSGVWIDVVAGSYEAIQEPWVSWQTLTGSVLINVTKVEAIRAAASTTRT
jgi:hypothetical protein